MTVPLTLWIGIGALLTIVTTYLGVATLRAWALSGNVVDIPNARSSHTRPTPRGGGLAIAFCTLAALWLLLLGLRRDFTMVSVASYTVAALLIAVVSWYDDLHSLSNRLRFGVHALAALIILVGVGAWNRVSLPLIGDVWLGWLGFAVTVLWLVGLINAYNFMDGIDGLAGGQAVVAGVAWGIIGWWQGNLIITMLGILITAASSGFLLHNWPPARIFMGDVGSAFLGFSFAVLAIMGSLSDPRLAVVGGVVVWLLIFDTIFTLLRRWRLGENIFEAHRSHLYQRLVIAGHPHRTVTMLYLVLSLVSCSAAAFWLLFPAVGGWLLMLYLVTSAAGLWLYVQRVEASAHLTSPITAASPSEPG